MLHLSFTQQLCHVAKIKVGNAANDAIFGSLNADEEKALHQKQADVSNTAYSALRDLAQRLLNHKT
jgi:hypothetical protein